LDKYNQEKIFKLNNFLTSGQQKWLSYSTVLAPNINQYLIG
jgi:hypothetical protein